MGRTMKKTELWVGLVNGIWGVWFKAPGFDGSTCLVECLDQDEAERFRDRMLSVMDNPGPAVLTPKGYSKRSGTCPCCASQNVEGGTLDIGSGEAWQAVTCNTCSATWTDVYKLTGYETLTTFEGNALK
jgi:hypothetical protein